MADEEIVEDQDVDAGSVEGAEFVPDVAAKPKSDVYSLLLILSFVVFLAGSIVVGRECWEFYDVQYWGIFAKK